MNEREQIRALSNDLDALILRYSTEFEISYASVAGVLQHKIHNLFNELILEEDEDE